MLRHVRLASDQRGAIAVLIGVMMPLIVLLLSFVIDTGNWWVHDRHLQTQADAGALAGAQGPWFPACDERDDRAAGVARLQRRRRTTSSTSLRAPSRALLNSSAYAEKGGSDSSDGGTPCQTLDAAPPRRTRGSST